MAKQSTTPRPVIGDLLKSLPKAETPIQEVRPVAEPSKVTPEPAKPEQVRISGFWVEADLAEQFRLQGAKENRRPRELLIDAIKAYLAAK